MLFDVQLDREISLYVVWCTVRQRGQTDKRAEQVTLRQAMIYRKKPLYKREVLKGLTTISRIIGKNKYYQVKAKFFYVPVHTKPVYMYVVTDLGIMDDEF